MKQQPFLKACILGLLSGGRFNKITSPINRRLKPHIGAKRNSFWTGKNSFPLLVQLSLVCESFTRVIHKPPIQRQQGQTIADKCVLVFRCFVFVDISLSERMYQTSLCQKLLEIWNTYMVRSQFLFYISFLQNIGKNERDC
ncbi:hypothetical protein O6H91_17G086400 [Diphasiastrum complanatum]|uniref:Uncharacterized protein n=1 Tax=Diphasiastrum complanatum TaxID=34168 RepID=A0ACC2B8V3_DIPCM|nr:hypothetical protein O6H91_Y494600 [Diphasiastrum complanatum]KAJ7294377.1 hypothetical protein O6H91_Y261300 [Diphasiastrum complanatum]KAJ7297486.1 hypothetical protein O6H91_Y053400 [Diphasiastrum complanatum]KAJ7297487.1 hypothetical protein O6H91_Y053400 [Diphasiastrum complanatum]KAJ7526190.1 hypothetical protein O6H91_17G086400 [Diphasiastrum complanatum]